MTVKELIHKLQDVDQELEVQLNNLTEGKLYGIDSEAIGLYVGVGEDGGERHVAVIMHTNNDRID